MIHLIIIGSAIGAACTVLGLSGLGINSRKWACIFSIVGFFVTGAALFVANAKLISLYLTDKTLLSDYLIVDLDFVIYTGLIVLIFFFIHLATLISLIATNKDS
ncbi:MAG: hypothetical protein ABIJ81_04380 [Patescibacteria group bacterium]